MRRMSLPHLALGLALAACGKPDPQLAVVLQSWANAEHAQQVCERARTWQQQNRSRIAQAGCDAVPLCREMMPLVTRCAANPVADLRAFEDELLARAASAPQCKGVRIVRLDARIDDGSDSGPVAAPNLERPHWRLYVDYQPGEPRQRWRIADSPSRATFPKGEGDPLEIAEAICPIVTGRGAKRLE